MIFSKILSGIPPEISHGYFFPKISPGSPRGHTLAIHLAIATTMARWIPTEILSGKVFMRNS